MDPDPVVSASFLRWWWCRARGTVALFLFLDLNGRRPKGGLLLEYLEGLEDQLDNARGWYKKAKREFPGRDAVKQEIAAARKSADGDGAPVRQP